MSLASTRILLATLFAFAPLSMAGAATPTSASEETVAPIFSARDHWRERLEFDYEFDVSDAVSVSFDTNVVDVSQRGFEQKQNIDPLSLLRSENKSIGDTGVDIAFFEGRLKIASRYGWSSFDGAAAAPETFANASSWQIGAAFDEDRALGDDRGHAFAHEVEASLLRSTWLDVSAFGTYHDVDSSYSLVANGNDAGKRGNDRNRGAFGDHGKRYEFGGRFRVGPLQASVSRKHARKWVGDARDELGPEHQTLEAAATLSLYGFRERSREVVGATTSRLIPDAIWVSVSEGSADPVGPGSTSDAIRNTSFGMSWSADTWSVGVDYWRSLYDSRQHGAEDADWQGQGLYLNYGYYRATWGIYATGGLGQYANLARSSRSEDLAIDSSLTLQLTPERLPKLTFGVSYGHYATDYIAYAGNAAVRGLSFTSSLDFARYLPEVALSKHPARLELGYRYTATETHDSFAGSASAGEHAAVLVVELPF